MKKLLNIDERYVPKYFEKLHGDKGGIKMLLIMYYDLKSYTEIGKYFGLKKQRIHQVLSPLIAKDLIPTADQLREDSLRKTINEVIPHDDEVPSPRQ